MVIGESSNQEKKQPKRLVALPIEPDQSEKAEIWYENGAKSLESVRKQLIEAKNDLVELDYQIGEECEAAQVLKE